MDTQDLFVLLLTTICELTVRPKQSPELKHVTVKPHFVLEGETMNGGTH